MIAELLTCLREDEAAVGPWIVPILNLTTLTTICGAIVAQWRESGKREREHAAERKSDRDSFSEERQRDREEFLKALETVSTRCDLNVERLTDRVCESNARVEGTLRDLALEMRTNLKREGSTS